MKPVVLAPSRLEQAAEALGWAGTVIDGVRLVDAAVAAVVSGAEPTGLIVPVRGSWRRALSVARTCLPLAPTALLHTGPEAPSELCLLECGYAEVGLVVDADGAAVVSVRPRPQRPVSSRAINRALAEQLSERLNRASRLTSASEGLRRVETGSVLLPQA